MTALHPAAAGLDYTAEIALQSAALADAADGNLAAPVEHCPGWTVADLVRHLLEVHWFWAMIAERRPSEPPSDEGRPAPPPEDQLIERFRAGALNLVEVLRHADPQAPVGPGHRPSRTSVSSSGIRCRRRRCTAGTPSTPPAVR